MKKAEEIAKRHPDDHPFRVAARVGPEDRDVALLHDSLEDGYSNLQEIGINFHGQVMQDVIELTRLPEEPYKDYIARVRRRGGRARRVKIADINENLQRCKPSLIERYVEALKMLEEGS